MVSLYARENSYQKEEWKQKVRSLFREKIQKALQEQYDFYAMTPRLGVLHKEYLHTHFQELLGKIYRPFDDTRYLSLALDKKDKVGNEHLLATLRQDYHIEPCALGENPKQLFGEVVKSGTSSPPNARQGVLMVMMENYAIKSTSFLSSGKIAIGIKMTKTGMNIIRHIDDIGFILFHIRGNEGQHLFAVSQTPRLIDKEEMEQLSLYPSLRDCNIYLLIEFNADQELDSSSLNSNKIKVSKRERYDANYCQVKDLLESL